MLQDVHSRKIKEPISAPAGDTVLVARDLTTPAWNYIHEIIGDMSAAGTMSIIAIDSDATEHVLATFTLADGQGLTLQDEPGEDNRPRFEFNPDQNAVMRTVGGTFTGAMDRSIRN
jgi:hypothetical protein